MRGLYALVDLPSLALQHLDPVAFAQAVLQARPAALQVRSKGVQDTEVLDILSALRPLCNQAEVPLFANDRVDLAVRAGCDGVHLGQGDREAAIPEGLRLGLSTHTEAQVEAALAECPDYLAYGPLFATSSKEDAAPVVGLSALQHVFFRARRAGVPLVVIGGIDLARAREVAPWVDAVAGISALLPPKGLGGAAAWQHVTTAAEAFQDLWPG